MRFFRRFAIGLLAVAAALAPLAPAPVFAADGQTMVISGVDYTKWLWGNLRDDGSLYNFTTVPGEGYGDNGQGTEIELLIAARPSKYVEVNARIHSRFSQNQWTNFGGFGGRNPALEEPPAGPCIGGDCGEFDPRSNQYIKLRGLTARFTPGFKWVDAVSIGSTDLGMFDPFTIGKIRYIDRDNAAAVLFQGSVFDRKLGYDLIRISLPRLWAGPNFETGDYTAADGAYGLQLKMEPNQLFDVVGIVERVRDIEVDSRDQEPDDGRDVRTRFENDVYGVKLGIHPSSMFDIRAAAYFSDANSEPIARAPANFFSISGFSPVPAGKLDDESFKANVDINDPFGVGLSFNLEYFDIGAQYVSHARRPPRVGRPAHRGTRRRVRLPRPGQLGLRRLRRQPHPHRLRRLAGERAAGRHDQRGQRVHRLRRNPGRDGHRLERDYDHPGLDDRQPRPLGRVQPDRLQHQLAGLGRRQPSDRQQHLSEHGLRRGLPLVPQCLRPPSRRGRPTSSSSRPSTCWTWARASTCSAS